MAKLRRKVITIEVETEATNAEIKRRYPCGEIVYIGVIEQRAIIRGIVKRVSVNDVTPKGGKGKR